MTLLKAVSRATATNRPLPDGGHPESAQRTATAPSALLAPGLGQALWRNPPSLNCA